MESYQHRQIIKSIVKMNASKTYAKACKGIQVSVCAKLVDIITVQFRAGGKLVRRATTTMQIVAKYTHTHTCI